MNRLFVGVAATLAVLLSAGGAEAQAPRLAYIDSQQIMAEAPGTADARAAMDATMAQYREELAAMEQELETLQQEFERQQATLTAAVRQERQLAMQEKFTAYQQRAAQMEQEAAQRQAELVQPIMERIQTVIEQIQSEGNYAMIFDRAAGGIIAGDPGLDLTQQVLERLASGTP